MKKILLIVSVLCVALVASSFDAMAGSAAGSASGKGRGKKIIVEKFGQTYAFRDSASLQDFLNVYDSLSDVNNIIECLNQASGDISEISDLIDRINNDIYMHNVQEFDINNLRMKLHDLSAMLSTARSNNEDLDRLVQSAYTKLDRAEDRMRYGAWDDFYMNIEDYFDHIRRDFSDCQGFIAQAQIQALTLFNEYQAQMDCFKPLKRTPKKANK